MSDATQTDPRIPPAEACVMPYLVRRYAADRPDQVFAVFETGDPWCWGQVHADLAAMAGGLRALGLGWQDKLLVWLPNGKLALSAMYAANYLGAISVAINTAYRGGLLEHVLGNSGAALGVIHPDLLERLLELKSCGKLKTVLTTDEGVLQHEAAFAAIGLQLLPLSVLAGGTGADLPAAGLQPWTTQSIVYTSGTTGPSKGVLSSYLHLATAGIETLPQLVASDRYMINLPLFHAGATLAIAAAVVRGASIALIGGFSTATFLETCRRLDVTVTILLGVMVNFLLSQPRSAADRDHALRLAMVLPLGDEATQLRERFGFDIVTTFNMSETSGPIRSALNPTARGSCGQPRPGIAARIVDENDIEVPAGQAGELVLRADAPWVMFHGYNDNPDATAKAWRNGWFHTGDSFRQDADGNYFFVDRVKDAIRRRGENISSFEVECEVLAHPAVREAAAVGLPSALGEEDVMVVVALKPEAALDPADLLRFLQPRMPGFMVPRYVRFVEALPKTPTSKVQKHVLRGEGATPDTWDRDAAGMTIKRERLGS